MSSTRRQRRALRAIEQALAEQDLWSADRLTGPPAAPQPATVADGVAWSMFWVALLLLTAGPVLVNSSLPAGALLVLGMLPPLVLLVAAGAAVDR
jgi:hypothetical protein